MFFTATPSPNLKLCVIIPVKDEEETIIQSLEALRAQKDSSGFPIKQDLYEVLILANNCQDNTYELIKNYQSLYPEFPLLVEEIIFTKGRANIGTARRFLMDMAYDRFVFLNKADGIIASTDGDTQVDRNWISEIEKEMEKGCDVVGGEIITELEDCFAKQYHLRDIKYQNLIARLESLIDPQSWNPWPSHFQCFGASFAIKCHMYKKAGRLPQIPCLEDVAFLQKLELKDAKIRRSPHLKVFTSARKVGRVDKGLSQQLAWFESLGSKHQEQVVECAESVISRIRIRKSLFNFWKGQKLDWLKNQFEIAALQKWLDESQYFGEFWMKAHEDLKKRNWFEQWEPVNIEKALEDMEFYISEIERPLEYH